MLLSLTRRLFIRSLAAATSATLGGNLWGSFTAAAEDVTSRVITLNSGAKMPLIGLGTWESSPGEVGAAVKAALDAGCRHIDCAAAYRNEAEVGTALASSAVPRGEIFLTSKLWNDRRRPEDVRDALNLTLSRLGTSYLDLYLIHWPVVWARDSVMRPDSGASLKECWRTLEQLVDEGKLKQIGISNFKQSELAELLAYARIPPAVNQIELHPRLPQTSLVHFCASKGIGVTAYSPLGRGGVKKAGLLTNPTVQQIAAAHSVSPASVLLRWNIQRNVVVIPKSVTPERIARNSQEPWTFNLHADEVAALDALEDGARFCTAPWSTFDDKRAAETWVGRGLTGIASVLFRVVTLDITK